MRKIVVVLTCLVWLVGLSTAGILGLERKLLWLKNLRDSATNSVENQEWNQVPYLPGRQQFILDVLLQVHKPLVHTDLMELGKVLITEPHKYLEPTDENLIQFLEHASEHLLIGRNHIYNELNAQHTQQLIGLYKFLVLARDWSTFQRNVCFARLHMNPVMFVQALQMAVRDRADTQYLLMPAVHEVLPHLFYDSDIIKSAENVDWSHLIARTATKRPGLMDILGLRGVGVLAPGHVLDIDKRGLWQPWKEWRMHFIGSKKGLFAPQEAVAPPNDAILVNEEQKIVVPVERIHPISYLTDDPALNSFWNQAINERLVQKVTGRRNRLLQQQQQHTQQIGKGQKWHSTEDLTGTWPRDQNPNDVKLNWQIGGATPINSWRQHKRSIDWQEETDSDEVDNTHRNWMPDRQQSAWDAQGCKNQGCGVGQGDYMRQRFVGDKEDNTHRNWMPDRQQSAWEQGEQGDYMRQRFVGDKEDNTHRNWMPDRQQSAWEQGEQGDYMRQQFVGDKEDNWQGGNNAYGRWNNPPTWMQPKQWNEKVPAYMQGYDMKKSAPWWRSSVEHNEGLVGDKQWRDNDINDAGDYRTKNWDQGYRSDWYTADVEPQSSEKYTTDRQQSGRHSWTDARDANNAGSSDRWGRVAMSKSTNWRTPWHVADTNDKNERLTKSWAQAAHKPWHSADDVSDINRWSQHGIAPDSAWRKSSHGVGERKAYGPQGYILPEHGLRHNKHDSNYRGSHYDKKQHKLEKKISKYNDKLNRLTTPTSGWHYPVEHDYQHDIHEQHPLYIVAGKFSRQKRESSLYDSAAELLPSIDEVDTIRISPTIELLSVRSGELFMQNLQQMHARLTMGKISCSAYQHGFSWAAQQHPQLTTTVGGPYKQSTASELPAKRSVQKVVQQLRTKIDDTLQRQQISHSSEEVLRVIGDILIGNNGHLGNTLEQMLLQINREVYGVGVADDVATDLTLSTANLHDPVYQQLISDVVQLIDQYKRELLPYTEEDIVADGDIQINDVQIDHLVTYMEDVDADLINLVDQQLLQSNGNNLKKLQRKVVARQQRLNHEPFTFSLDVTAQHPQSAIVRTFLVPQVDQSGQQLSLDRRQLQFVQLDAFVTHLQAGRNHIERASHEINWTARDVSTLSEIYHRLMTGQSTQTLVGADCRFPHRLLIPRGTAKGLPVQFIAIITPITEEDEALQHLVDTEHLCGLGIAGMALDRMPLGYPLDRPIDTHSNIDLPNIKIHNTIIQHDEHVRIMRI